MPSRYERITNSKKAKNDEFYTLYDDIASELPNYKKYLANKRIICPCDWDESFEEEIVYSDGEYYDGDNLFSQGDTVKNIDILKTRKKFEKDLNLVKCNFVKFLVAHAEDYKIKSITVSGYDPQSDKGVKFQNLNYSNYDLVITNPPFSLFIDFIETMFKNKMDFIVIGPQHAVAYKEVFKHIKENEMWMGYNYHLLGFQLPDGTVLPKNDNLPRSCGWYTNLPVKYRNDKLILTEEYSKELYPHYDNFDGIDVSKTKLIPKDYDGYMGVPITFLQKYNPDQFEIVGMGTGDTAKEIGITKNYRGRTDLAFTKDGKNQCPYGRIVIKNKEVEK